MPVSSILERRAELDHQKQALSYSSNDLDKARVSACVRQNPHSDCKLSNFEKLSISYTGSSTLLRYTPSKILKMRALTSTGQENFSACIAMIVVTAIFIIARFAVRLSQRQAPLGSDWVCLLSLGLFYAYCGLILNCESAFILLSAIYQF